MRKNCLTPKGRVRFKQFKKIINLEHKLRIYKALSCKGKSFGKAISGPVLGEPILWVITISKAFQI